MKKAYFIAASLAVAVLLSAGCGKKEEAAKGAGLPAQPAQVQVSRVLIAAASALKIEPPFRVVADFKAADGKYVGTPLGPNGEHTNKPCTASYEFTVPKTDTYYLWIRKNWSGGCSNSLFVKLDDQPEFIFGEDGTYDHWDWVDAMRRKFDLSAGKHKMVIKNREDDSKFDQILFIANKDYVPQGIEEK